MNRERALAMLDLTKQYFDRSTGGLEEADSGFAPREGMMTAAQTVAHVAQTVDWFFEGAFRPEGMDMAFADLMARVMAVRSLKEARGWLDRSMDAARRKVEGLDPSEWAKPIQGPLMAGMPRESILGGIAEHTAHHRGALTVYQRLLGKTPAMPYM